MTSASVLPAKPAAIAPVALTWLVTIRWLAILAGVGAIVAGRTVLQVRVPAMSSWSILGACAASNAWLTWSARTTRNPAMLTIAGLLVSVDVLVLSWLLLNAGGVLNPASVFYLIEIVAVALVLGRVWTWIVTALSVSGYAALFLAPVTELAAAQSMHPEIALHMRGMWIAFALTALVIAALVTRLAIAVERRDLALTRLREQADRATRAAGLTTLAAGAAHELGTPLSTIAVAARELDRALTDDGHHKLAEDARLIRAETDRCREILDGMVGRSAGTAGEAPRPIGAADLLHLVLSRLSAAERSRVTISAPPELVVVWPVQVLARAVTNLLQNALQASGADTHVTVEITTSANDRVDIRVIDRGPGMPPDVLDRAGEPFYSTKPAGAGTGLGLFVARSSLEQLGGSLRIDSRAGHGTTVTATLPPNVVHPHV